jgi:addiction module HigA family antidote
MKMKKNEQMPPIHPGEILLEDFMKPLGLSQYRVAKAINVPPRRINEIVQGKRAVTAETALRLERYLGWPAQVWLNLQSRYEMETTAPKMGDALSHIVAAVQQALRPPDDKKNRPAATREGGRRRRLADAA